MGQDVSDTGPEGGRAGESPHSSGSCAAADDGEPAGIGEHGRPRSADTDIERLLERFATDVLHLQPLGGSRRECYRYCKAAWPKHDDDQGGGLYTKAELDVAFTVLAAAIQAGQTADE